jgi:hypothetical protein
MSDAPSCHPERSEGPGCVGGTIRVPPARTGSSRHFGMTAGRARLSSTLLFLFALLALTARAQDAPPPQMATVVVPVVGTVNGPMGVRW